MEGSTWFNEATRLFIAQHADDDVRQLALRGSKDAAVDLPMALQQIQGRQAARRKLPSWAVCDGIVYPPHLNMEQCSSELTARYKRTFAGGGSLLMDLTGGLGVDFAFMSEAFESAIYVEQNAELHAIARANFGTLGLAGVEAACADGVDFLHHFESHATLIYLDPARRDSHGQRTYGIGDCTPNVLPLLEELLGKADRVLLKLSPMLDWHKAVGGVGRQHVEQVHIVAVAGECKELLLLLSRQGCEEPRLVCANLSPNSPPPTPPEGRGGWSPSSIETFPLDAALNGNNSFLPSSNINAKSNQLPSLGERLRVGELRSGMGQGVGRGRMVLYEPHAALMKAGVFGLLAERYGLTPLAPNSHLFVSGELVEQFPGRRFRVVAVSTMNKRELKEKVLPLQRADISVRNFPMSVAELRQRLKLGEGGGNHLFATTLASGQRVIIVTQPQS